MSAGRCWSLALAIAPLFSQRPGPEEPSEEAGVEDLLTKGEQLWEAGDTDAAMGSFREALTVAPGHAHTKRLLGNRLHYAGRFAESRAELAQAVQLQPDHKVTRKFLSDAAAADGDLEAALRHFGLAAAVGLRPLAPNLAKAWRTPPPARRGLRPLGSSMPYYVEPSPGLPPQSALRTLRKFLNREVLGAAYDFGFRSGSVPVDSRRSGDDNLLAQVLEYLKMLVPPFVQESARCAEWWVHRRPPKPLKRNVRRVGLEGHPFHWDDDGPEALGNRTKPLFTSLLFLNGATGASPSPTLVLNTTRVGGGFEIGSTAWVLHAREGRAVLIPGGMLHGVLPSAGALEIKTKAAFTQPLRLSLNVAWWAHACNQTPSQGLGRFSKLMPSRDAFLEKALVKAPDEPIVHVPDMDTHVFCWSDSCKDERAADEL